MDKPKAFKLPAKGEEEEGDVKTLVLGVSQDFAASLHRKAVGGGGVGLPKVISRQMDRLKERLTQTQTNIDTHKNHCLIQSCLLLA